MKKITIKDVAKKAGVSVGSVSRVINNSSNVGNDIKIKVKKAISELDYKVDEYARGLKSNHTNTVALILPTIWHPFFAEFAFYVEKELSIYGTKLILCNSENNSDKEYEYIQMVKQNKVDGIIGITYADIDQYVSSELPFISIDRHFYQAIPCVTCDNFMAGWLAAEQLTKRGCKNLAYISGISVYPSEISKRGMGFKTFIAENEINAYFLEMQEPIVNKEKQIIDFYHKHTDIDGIFAINDFMAIDVINSLNKKDVSFPENIQIIGCDGIKNRQESDFLISTIKQPVEEMAKQSVKLLSEVIKNPSIHSTIVLPVEFVEGKTTINKN